MRRLVLLSLLTALVVWRNRRLESWDRAHGYGRYVDLSLGGTGG